MEAPSPNSIAGREALRLARENFHNKLHPWVKDYDGVANICYEPKFKLNPQSTFFTIGSCFARLIEVRLSQKGIPLIKPPALAEEYYKQSLKSKQGATGGYTNVYTPGSILEISRLVESPDPYHSIVLMDGYYHDLLAHYLKGLPHEKSRSVRSGLLDTYRRLVEADVMILTLGHIEAWYYKISKSWINHTMADSVVRKRPDDYSFDLLGISEVIEMLKQALENFRKANPRLKFILTVSPVHLRRTYTKDHIVVANQRSKSTLLAAAQHLNSNFDDVDYFPSYEIVTQTKRHRAYAKDGSHVRPSMSNHVMETFFEAYLDMPRSLNVEH